MSYTNFLEHASLDHVFGASTFTPSGTLYVALSTTTPAEDGSSFTEPATASGYARVAVTNNKTNWSTASQVSTSGEVHNRTVITFPTSSGNWGTISHFGIFDNPTTGNLYLQAPLSGGSQTININNQISFASGTLKIRMD
jgi:hypothetical protein